MHNEPDQTPPNARERELCEFEVPKVTFSVFLEVKFQDIFPGTQKVSGFSERSQRVDFRILYEARKGF